MKTSIPLVSKKSITTRVPPEVHTILEQMAAREHRSLGAQVAHILRLYLDIQRWPSERIRPEDVERTHVPPDQ